MILLFRGENIVWNSNCDIITIDIIQFTAAHESLEFICYISNTLFVDQSQQTEPAGQSQQTEPAERRGFKETGTKAESEKSTV